MDEHQCTNCGAALPRTGTYCLACDTPVTDAVRGLSVGDTQVVKNGRPIVAVAIVVGVAVVVAGITFGVRSFMDGHDAGKASSAARKGVDIVVRAESGHAGACPYVSTAIAGDPKTEKQACLALVNDDPGAHINHLRAASVHRDGDHGTVELRGTLVDKAGKRPFVRTVPILKHDGSWMLQWDGKSLASAS